MIKSVTVTNYKGDSVKLILGEPEKSGFLIKGIEGLGPTKANINTTELSTNDGAVYNSAKLTSRNIVFDLLFVETRGKDNRIAESIEDIRHKSYKFFAMKKNLELVVETDNRVAKITGYVESNEPTIFSQEEGTRISIVCPDPFFYSDTIVTNLHTVEPTFEFPFSNESLDANLLSMSNLHLITKGSVVYTGDHEVGIGIKIHANGSATNIEIHNVNTKEKMILDSAKITTITGSDIIEGDDIIINTMRGHKSITLIREGVSYNILNCLGRDTDWFTLSRGDNLFEFVAEEGISKLYFVVTNKLVYEGV